MTLKRKSWRDHGGGVPLGLVAEAAFPAGRVRIAPGDTVLFFTDGLTEVFNARNQMFGEGPMQALLAHVGDASAESLRDRLLEAQRVHTGGAPAADDVTLVVMHREGDGAARG